MQTISATDLARNTRKILDNVVSCGESVAIERNHTMVAKILPSEPMMTASQALDGLGVTLLTPSQAAAWIEDSRENFGETVRDRWA